MFAIYQNRYLPPDVRLVDPDPAPYWAEALDTASHITARVVSEPIGEPISDAGRQEVIWLTGMLMAQLLIIARHHVIDVDLITSAMAIAASETHSGPAEGDIVQFTPHGALAYLVSQANSTNPYLRAMGLAIGLTRDPYSAGDLAAALQGSVAAQPADPYAFTRLWVGYAVLLAQIGSSMAAAMGQLCAELDRLLADPQALRNLQSQREAP